MDKSILFSGVYSHFIWIGKKCVFSKIAFQVPSKVHFVRLIFRSRRKFTLLDLEIVQISFCFPSAEQFQKKKETCSWSYNTTMKILLFQQTCHHILATQYLFLGADGALAPPILNTLRGPTARITLSPVEKCATCCPTTGVITPWWISSPSKACTLCRRKIVS